jgi:hypothetical protein
MRRAANSGRTSPSPSTESDAGSRGGRKAEPERAGSCLERRCGWCRRPVDIPKLPQTGSMFCDGREEPILLHPLARRTHANLMVRSAHDSEVGRQRIYSQVIAPSQFYLLDGMREILNGRHRRRAIRKHQASVHGHEEGWTVVEVSSPRLRAVASHILSNGSGERSDALLDSAGARRRQGFRCFGHWVPGAASDGRESCHCARAPPGKHDDSS